MIRHPDIQEKAYAEIARVIGENRLPTLDDTGNLPYVDALIKELHRYHPTVPVLTRSATNSDEFQNRFIPQNAWVLTNIW
jgi:cytochrome P450